jgi:hypothetical protein
MSNQSLAVPELLILDDSSSFFAEASQRLPELHPPSEESPDDRICHLEYPSGDIYDGEVLKEDEITFRHGQGKLVSADGSIYEVCLPSPESPVLILSRRVPGSEILGRG